MGHQHIGLETPAERDQLPDGGHVRRPARFPPPALVPQGAHAFVARVPLAAQHQQGLAAARSRVRSYQITATCVAPENPPVTKCSTAASARPGSPAAPGRPGADAADTMAWPYAAAAADPLPAYSASMRTADQVVITMNR